MSATAIVATPASRRRAENGRIARHRLYPVSALYTTFALGMLGLGLTAGKPVLALTWFGGGVAFWTLAEYLTHRYILHGEFPDGPGLWKHFLHVRFDHLHVQHHVRPYDANHINGTIGDTLPLLLPLVLLSFLAPPFTVSMFMAGFMQSHIVEEWVHQSVHFYDLPGPYFRYIRRHHLYHHSPAAAEVGYGLSNGFWDIICDTRIPIEIRRALYSNAPRQGGSRPPPSPSSF